MSAFRRGTASVTLLLTLALAAPASAATWRTVATVVAEAHRAEAEPSYSLAWAGARNVSQVQVGFKVSGSARKIDYAYEVTCWHDGERSTKRRVGLSKPVEPGGFRWVTVWSRTKSNMCDVQVETGLADLGAATVLTRARVR
ncbi:hypothetical protein BH23ACT10_BH23ACT10_17250 [soil metagenome]